MQYPTGFIVPNTPGHISFNILGFPTTLFFDRDHKLSKRWTGYLDEENLIEQLEKINN